LAGASLRTMYFNPDLVVKSVKPSWTEAVAGPVEKEGVTIPSMSALAMVGIVRAVVRVVARKFRLLFADADADADADGMMLKHDTAAGRSASARIWQLLINLMLIGRYLFDC